MKRLDGNDELISKIAGVDPAARLAPMTEGALDRVTRHAMSPVPKPWTWGRFPPRVVRGADRLGRTDARGHPRHPGSGVGLLEPPNPCARQFSLDHRPARRCPDGGRREGRCDVHSVGDLQLHLGPEPLVVRGVGHGVSASSSIDASAAATQLAQALNVPGDVTTTGDGSYQVGPSNGPNVSTWTSNGVVSWYFYDSTPTVTSPDGTPPASDPTLPTNAQAADEALAELGHLGVTNQLGTPSVSNYGTEVDVTIPIVVDGLATDQSFYVAYGANNTLNSVSGEFVTATAETTYPTISQTDAVQVLQDHNGAVFYGGVMPMSAASSPGGSSSSSSTGPSASSGTSPSAPPSGAVGDSSPPFTDPTTTIPEPVYDVNINQATMQLSTYTLTDGTSWLLPTWALSGPETGTSVTADTTYTANVLAVDSQYVHLQTGPMVY